MAQPFKWLMQILSKRIHAHTNTGKLLLRYARWLLKAVLRKCSSLKSCFEKVQNFQEDTCDGDLLFKMRAVFHHKHFLQVSAKFRATFFQKTSEWYFWKTVLFGKSYSVLQISEKLCLCFCWYPLSLDLTHEMTNFKPWRISFDF